MNTEIINNSINDTTELPFVGIRSFETRPGVSGNATPSWFVQIQKNRDVTFCYMHVDQGDENKPIYTEIFYAGKFTKYIWCNFEELDDFPRRFIITDSIIYEVDSSLRLLSLQECCGFEEYHSTCNCDGELWISQNEFTSKYVDSLFRTSLPH